VWLIASVPKKPLQPQDKYVVRLPDGLRDRIREAAAENGRSMNAEIVARLEKYPKLAGLEPLLAFANAERARLEQEAVFLKEQHEFWTNVVTEASANVVEGGSEHQKLGGVIERMRRELTKLLLDRRDAEKAQVQALMEQQAELIDQLRSTQRLVSGAAKRQKRD